MKKRNITSIGGCVRVRYERIIAARDHNRLSEVARGSLPQALSVVTYSPLLLSSPLEQL